jgi:hypothetical protein
VLNICVSKLTEGDSSQNHRKSTSLDNINLQQNGGLQPHHQQQQQQQQPHWKSYSLQRGLAPPDSELLSLQQHNHDEAAGIGLQALRSSSSAIGGNSASALVPQNGVGGATGEEDVYGRCTNMRLTSFTEAAAAAARDPRIIDLAQCTGVSMGNGSVAAAVSTAAVTLQNGGLHHPGGHSHHHHLPPMSAVGPSAAAAGVYPAVSNFNTLPVHLSGGGGGGLGHHSAVGGHHQPPLLHNHQHNTLPARVGESPPRTGPHHSSAAAVAAAASGRHFKPFDHRRMNPMAEIQENPYELQVSPTSVISKRKLGFLYNSKYSFLLMHFWCNGTRTVCTVQNRYRGLLVLCVHNS